MSFNSITTIKATFSGGTAAGAISVPGVKVGDVIVQIADAGDTARPGYFENMVSVDDEIQQFNSNDFSSITFTAVLVR